MKDQNKTKDQLINELIELRQRITDLEVFKNERNGEEKRLQESEKLLRTFMNAIKESAFVVDTEGIVLTSNETLGQRLGMSVNELLGTCIYHHLPPEIARERKAQVDKVIRTGKPLRYEDGRAGEWVDSFIYPIFDEEGRVAKIGIIAVDITERKQMEGALRESEDRYRDLVEHSHDLIYTHDLKGQVHSVNQGTVRLLGYEKSVLRKKNIRDILAPEFREEFDTYLETIKRDGVAKGVMLVQTATGEKRTWEYHNTLRREGIDIPTVRGMAHDITEQKLAEKALRKSEEKFKELFDNAPVGYHEFDIDGRITHVNRTELEMLGYTREERIGQFVWSSITEEEKSRQTVLGKLAGAILPSRSLERTYRRKDGTTFPVLIQDQLLRDEKGRITGIRSTIQDITEHKKSMKRFSKLNKCFLDFGVDAHKNINQLVALCGEELDATCALYNRLEDGKLYSLGQWNVPPDYNPLDNPDGHICYDVIQSKREEIFVIRNLLQTSYAQTDPNVIRYNLKTYIGKAVSFAGNAVGSLCVVYQDDRIFSEDDKHFLEIVSSAIGIEEERKRAEEALGKSEEKFRELYNEAPVGYHEYDSEGRITNVNQTDLEMLGYTREEMIGEFMWKFNVEEKIAHQQILAKLSGGLPPGRNLERTYRRKDGTAFPVLIQDRILRDEKGQIKGTRCIIQDITERKQTEEDIKRLAYQHELILNSAGEGIYGLNLDGEVTFINSAAVRMLGWGVEEVIGKNSHETWHHTKPDGTSFPREECSLNILLKSGIGQTAYGDWFWRKDGTGFSVEYTNTPIYENERLRGAVVTFKDITEQKRIIEEKEKLESQLIQSQKMEAIGQLAGGIAHDFNNLLTVIRGYSQLSLSELQKQDPLWENIEEIEKAANRASEMTRQLLAFSRRQLLEFKVIDMNALIQDMEKMLRRMIREDIELMVEPGENLGKIKADPGQIEQIILNLAVNAKDAMPSEGKLILETRNVELDGGFVRSHLGSKPGRYVRLMVTDTGCGMSKEVRERVFEPFFTTKGKGEGTGLGLSTVYGIVKQSGGYIWVSSEPGRGTSVEVYLPWVDEAVEVFEEEVKKERILQGDETILVVEDEETVRKLAALVLRKQGYKVLEALHGGDALLVCEGHVGPIHLIITDVVMPGMGGPELIERLQGVRQDFRVLYMSGYTDEPVASHGVEAGEMEFIQKPFTLEGLARKVREVLDH